MSSSPSSRRRYTEYLAKRRSTKPDSKSSPVADEESKKKKRTRSFLTLFRAFWQLLRGSYLTVFAALATLSVHAGLLLLLPACIKAAWDYAINAHPGPAAIPRWLPISEFYRDPAHRLNLLYTLGGVMISITLIRILFGMWGRWQMTRLTKRTQMLMRRRAFDHAIRLPLHRVQQIKSGGVTSMIREDAGGAAELLFQVLYNPWNALIQLCGTLIILAVVDWRMLLAAVAFIPLLAYMHKVWLARIRPLYRDIKSTRTSIDAHATESFGGIRVVRSFDRSRGETGRFSRGIHFMSRQEILTWWWSRGIEIAWFLMIPLATTAVLVFGGREVIRGNLTVGDVIMFTTLLMFLLGPMELLAASASDMQTNLAAFDRVLDLLAEPTEFHTARGDIEVSRATAKGRITLRNVSFAYPLLTPGGPEYRAAEPSKNGTVSTPAPPSGSPALGAPVLHNVSLDVQPGQTIALVGPSGSGKTTFCNLIARFYDPTEGFIEFDDTDLKKIDANSYRRLLGIVEQDVFLFDGTIAENIGYGRRDATAAQIAEAADLANATEFIDKLEKGYDTLIGERGVRLSGGQKQRLAIARAILADPLILILDEATSNLDTESERLIQRSLGRLMRGRTCFVIAHRLSTIRHADRIVVIEDGRIIETGTHDQLLASGGRYAEFLKIQVEGHAAPTTDGRPSTLPTGAGASA